MDKTLDRLSPTLYSLDSLRGEMLLKQFISPPANLNFDLNGRSVFFVSNQCDLHCTYCKGIEPHILPPTLTEFERMISRWRPRNLKYVHLTGLEPTRSPEIVDYVRIAGQYGMETSISTNGLAPYETYSEMVKSGLRYLFVSLDAQNDEDAYLMGRKPGIYCRVKENLTRLSMLKQTVPFIIVICLAVTKQNFNKLPEIVAHFLEVFKPDDIRLIPVAQSVFSQKERRLYAERIQPQLEEIAEGRYPFLNYRVRHFFSTRGLRQRAAQKCYVVLDEKTVAGNHIYPCNIYIRERGRPIASVDDPRQNRLIWQWFRSHNPLNDDVCSRYCCDVTREYNLMVEQGMDGVYATNYSSPDAILENIIHERGVKNLLNSLGIHADHFLFSHFTRTALIAGRLGFIMKWHFLTVYYLMRAAFLHDIGKAHPKIKHLAHRSGLSKSSKYALRRHTSLGRELLHKAGYVVEGEIARHHHERIDAKGYHGVAINWPMTEIVGLADAYAALTENRYDRNPYAPDQALDMILRGECGMFREQYTDNLAKGLSEGLLC